MDTPYRSIVDHIREAVIILQHCHLQYANPAAASLLALTESVSTSVNFIDFLPVCEQKNQLKQVCAQTEASQLACEAVLELEIVDAQGKAKTLQARAAPLLWQAAPATMCFLAEAPVSGQAMAVENATLYEKAQAEINERKRAQALANRYLEQQIIVNGTNWR